MRLFVPCTLEEDRDLGMLAVPPLREERGDETRRGETCFSIAGAGAGGGGGGEDDVALFLNFSDAGDLLDSINFDDIFAGDDALPDLEMDAAEVSAEFSTGSENQTKANPSVTWDGGGPKELSEAEEEVLLLLLLPKVKLILKLKGRENSRWTGHQICIGSSCKQWSN